MIKKISVRYASVRFSELNICQWSFNLIDGNREGEKHARSCLGAYAKNYKERMVQHKMEKLAIRVVIKYFCKKGMHPKEIHEDSMETSWKRSPSYSTVEKWAAEFKRGRESVDDDGWSGRPKNATTDENVKVVLTLDMYCRRRDLPSIAKEVGIRFGTVQSILTNILRMSKVLARWVPRMLTDDQKRTQLDISMHLLSSIEDDLGDFIPRWYMGSLLWPSQECRANNGSNIGYTLY